MCACDVCIGGRVCMESWVGKDMYCQVITSGWEMNVCTQSGLRCREWEGGMKCFKSHF